MTQASKNTPAAPDIEGLTFGGWTEDNSLIEQALRKLSFKTDTNFIETVRKGGADIEHVKVWYKVDVLNQEVPDHKIYHIDHGVVTQPDYRPEITRYAYDAEGNVTNSITYRSQKHPEHQSTEMKEPLSYFYVILGLEIAGVTRFNIGTCDLTDTEYGDPFTNAYAMALKRVAANFGLGIDLYFKENEQRYGRFKLFINSVIEAVKQNLLPLDKAKQAAKELKRGEMSWGSAVNMLKHVKRQGQKNGQANAPQQPAEQPKAPPKEHTQSNAKPKTPPKPKNSPKPKPRTKPMPKPRTNGTNGQAQKQ